jgi:hypothetical protein
MIRALLLAAAAVLGLIAVWRATDARPRPTPTPPGTRVKVTGVDGVWYVEKHTPGWRTYSVYRESPAKTHVDRQSFPEEVVSRADHLP